MADTETAPASFEDALLSALDEHPEDAPAEDQPPPEDETPSSEAPPDDSQPEETDPEDEAVDLFELAEKEGLDLRGKYKTTEDAARGLVNAARLVGQRNELAEWGKLIQERPQEVLAALQQRYGQPAPTKEPEPTETAKPSTSEADVARYLELKSSEPAWDPDWENQVTVDDKGRQVPTEDAEPGVMRKIAAHRRWESKIAEYVVRKPEVIVKAMGVDSAQKGELDKLRDELAQIKANEAKRESERFIYELAVQNREWMFKDGVVQPGNLTEAGTQFQYFFDQLLANNPNTKNPALIAEAAKSMTIAYRNQQASKAAPAAKKKPAEPKTDPAQAPRRQSMRDRITTAPGTQGRRSTHFSASAVGRGPKGTREWPKQNGHDMPLAERLAQLLGPEE